MPDSRSHESRQQGQMGRRVLRGSVVPLLVAVACSSTLLLSTACSQPRETRRSEVLATGVAATPEAAHQTPRPTPSHPPPPAPTPSFLPAVVALQQPAAPLPEAPSAPLVETAVPAPDPIEAPGPAVTTVVATENTAFVDRVVDLINAVRRKEGLEPLSPAPGLMEAAQRQARAMAEADRLGHTAPDGSSIESRMQAAGYRGWIVLAEVLAAGPASPEAVVALWLVSPEHRAHLLDPAVREFGVGYYYLSGSMYGHWWVVDLAAR